MAKVNAVKRSASKSDPVRRTKNSTELRRAEARLEKKREELLFVKAQHKKVAREFIDLWVKVNRIKKQIRVDLG
jgi:hypothetical protein